MTNLWIERKPSYSHFTRSRINDWCKPNDRSIWIKLCYRIRLVSFEAFISTVYIECMNEWNPTRLILFLLFYSCIFLFVFVVFVLLLFCFGFCLLFNVFFFLFSCFYFVCLFVCFLLLLFSTKSLNKLSNTGNIVLGNRANCNLDIKNREGEKTREKREMKEKGKEEKKGRNGAKRENEQERKEKWVRSWK